MWLEVLLIFPMNRKQHNKCSLHEIGAVTAVDLVAISPSHTFFMHSKQHHTMHPLHVEGPLGANKCANGQLLVIIAGTVCK